MSAAASTAAEVFPVLSCPAEGDEPIRERLLGLVEPTFARGAVAACLEANELELGERAPGLAPTIDAWLRGPLDFASVWAPPLTEVYAVARGDALDPVRAAATLGLHIAERGTAGDWSAELREPARLRFGGALLPAAGTVAVSSGPGPARVELDGHAVDPAGERLPGLEPGGLPRLLARDAVSPGCGLSEDVRALVVPELPGRALPAFSDALGALDEHAPEYSPWVRRVILDIVVLEVAGSGMRSGSHTSWPGVVYMSVEDPLVLADNLVHEASHQYFHLLARIEPVDDGSDGALYFSPVTGRERPLSAILVAYHAFANVALLLRAWMRSGLDERGYCEARLADVMPKLRVLEAPISASAALTETGRALSEPLIERMRALDGYA